jgi:hypothetical protein
VVLVRFKLWRGFVDRVRRYEGLGEVCTLFVHALLYGVFIVGFAGVVECFAEARRCHDVISSSGLVPCNRKVHL